MHRFVKRRIVSDTDYGTVTGIIEFSVNAGIFVTGRVRNVN